MDKAKKVSRKRILLGMPLIAMAVAAMLLAWEQSSPGDAEAGGPGMNLTAPANVSINTNFTVTITGSPLPGQYSGYATEIVFPTGLKWQQRATCGAEIGTTLVGGAAVGSCIRATGPAGEARHVIIAAIAAPPLPSLAGAPLISIDVRCNTAGTYKLALTAVPGSSFGAVYFADDTSPINVNTIAQDIDGDTQAENIADGQVVTCTMPPTATHTFTPTNTVPPTATRTPCPQGEVPAQGGGCGTPTMTPTEAPATPTPTPLPSDTQVVLSGPEQSPPGGAVDVTANVSDVDGNPLPGVTCVFTIADAPEGSDASLASDTAVTDEDGNAVVSLNVGTATGTINVQADCGGVAASEVLAVEVIDGVAPPETGEDGSGGATMMWALLATAMAIAVAGMGFVGWKKAVGAR